MYKLSPSSINLMIECPRCFWLKLVKNIKRPDSIFPSLPSGMDKILKEHFDRFMLKNMLPPELKGLNEEVKLFNDTELLKTWRNNFRGIQYLDKENDILLRGAVDNILVKGNKLIVLDYKTRGYPLKEDTHKHYQLQLDIYNFLLKKNNYETEDYSYLLFYYPNKVTKTGEVIFDTVLKKIKINSDNGEKIFGKAIKLLKRECPKEKCEWCKLIKTEE